jgi:hypothetical protein
VGEEIPPAGLPLFVSKRRFVYPTSYELAALLEPGSTSARTSTVQVRLELVQLPSSP